MRKLGIVLTTLLLLSCLVPGCSTSADTGTAGSPVTGYKTGNLAPDFSLKDIDGNSVSLASFLGKPVMLNFWALDCPYCLDEMPLLQTAYAEESTKADGITLLTINMKDSAQSIRSFFMKEGYTLTALQDSGSKITQSYGVSGIPTTFLIDRDGIIRYVKRGAFLSQAELKVAMDRIR